MSHAGIIGNIGGKWADSRNHHNFITSIPLVVITSRQLETTILFIAIQAWEIKNDL